MQIFNSIRALFAREIKLTYRNYYDVMTILLFFILGILIFVFAVGSNKEILNNISIAIIWTLLLLSTNLSISKFYEEDFNDGNLFLFHLSGLSFELIVLIKLIAFWFVYQLPFLLIIPIACLLLNMPYKEIILLLSVFLLSSPILTFLASISGSMNLLSNKNYAIGSVIVMLLSIPTIIFSVSITNAPQELIKPQLSIIVGILLLFLALTPWISAACIKIALKNK